MNVFEYRARRLEHRERLVERALAQRKDPEVQRQSAMALVVLAAVLSALFGALCLGAASETTQTETAGHLWWKSTTTTAVPTETRMGWLAAGLVLVLIGVALAVTAIRRAARRPGLNKYPAILTGVEAIAIQQLCGITGLSRSRVYRDIQTMIDSGMIDDFYIDYQKEQVVSRKYIPKTSHKTVVSCSGCGAPNDVIVGITRPCDYCGQPLLLASQ